jgi:hypothetical protein
LTDKPFTIATKLYLAVPYGDGRTARKGANIITRTILVTTADSRCPADCAAGADEHRRLQIQSE